MAGLTESGFIPLEFDEIVSNIETRLEAYNPGFDFSPESPDGQLINIMAVLIAQGWTELNNVYNSYNPNVAVGQSLKNIGLITGINKGAATRSQVIIELTGVDGTLVPSGSIFSDADGNEFYTNRDAYISTTLPLTQVTALAVISGPTPVPAGTVTTIVSQVTGLISIDQPADGTVGAAALTDLQYRTLRNKTVLRGSMTVQETISARVRELGIGQVTVINNDTGDTLTDGTPPNHIHVIVGEFTGVSDQEIGQAIFDTKSLGAQTYGTSSVGVQDVHGYNHIVNFSKATEVQVFIEVDVTFHAADTAGLEDAIKESLNVYINALGAGEDVIWSRLFARITPFGESEVNTLLIGKSAGTVAAANIPIEEFEYAANDKVNINLTVT